MVQGLLSFLIKTAVYMVVWVFILSLQWQGRTLFDRAHDVLVENSVVEFFDRELEDLWGQLVVTAQSTLQALGTRADKI